MRITDKDTLVIVAGGNAGALAGAAVAGAVSGAASLSGANRSAANIAAKAVFGVGMLMASEKARSGETKLFLEGMGTAPLYSLADEAIAAAVPGTNVADYVYAQVQGLFGGATSAVRGPGVRARAPVVAYSRVAPAARQRTATLGV